MDYLWHAAVLDTEFYAELQSALGVKLRHNPKGASDEDTENRHRRLKHMKALYGSFFGDKEPLVSKPSYVAPTHPIQPPIAKKMVTFIRSTKIMENVLRLEVHPVETVNEIRIPSIRQRLVIASR